jgi:hypothetical protein
MKAIGISSTFPAYELKPADAVIERLAQIRVRNLAGLSLEVEVMPPAS